MIEKISTDFAADKDARERINYVIRKKLKKLDLGGHHLITLPPSIGNAINLRELSLRQNHITHLPREIGNLINLQAIRLGDNNLTELPKELFQLKNLEYLSVWSNKLKNIPSDIGKLKKLRVLYLADNKISLLPPEIGTLKNLRELHLDDNLIWSLPYEINDLELHYINLKANPISQFIPVEIIESPTTPKLIFNSYFTIISSKIRKPINESKLLVIGQGSVGKTSLVQQILHGTFDPNQTKTEGISINQWTIDY